MLVFGVSIAARVFMLFVWCVSADFALVDLVELSVVLLDYL